MRHHLVQKRVSSAKYLWLAKYSLATLPTCFRSSSELSLVVEVDDNQLLLELLEDEDDELLELDKLVELVDELLRRCFFFFLSLSSSPSLLDGSSPRRRRDH